MRNTLLRTTVVLAALTACPAANRPVTRLEAVAFAPALGVDLAASTRLASGLYYRDLKVGSGPVARVGNAVTVYYSGALATGEIFDETKMGEPPLAFRIERGSPRPIAGFEQGIVGMQVSGMRQIIIPPELGYGATSHGAVPPNAVLVFTVELVTVK